MNDHAIFNDFITNPSLPLVPAKRLFCSEKRINVGMFETNRLALTMRGVINRSLDDTEGLQSADYSVYQLFEKDDLVFKLIDLENIKTSRVGIVPETGIMSPAYIRLKPNSESVVPRYYYWYFYAVYLNNVFNTLGGGIRQNLVVSDLLEVPVPDIPITLQANIADFLDKETSRIESLIGEKQRFIDLLKEKRQALISHFVTKGLDANVPMKDSGVEWIGEVPEHWVLPKLIQVSARIGDGLHGTPEYEDGTCLYFVNGNNLMDGTIRITSSTKEVSAVSFKENQLNLGTSTVFLSINGTIGNVALYRGESIMLGKSAAYINVSKDVEPEFLRYSLQSGYAKTFYDLEVTGTTISNLSLNSIRKFRIALPPVEEQQKIVSSLATELYKLDSLSSEVESSISLLKEHRTALISAAVTGKIDVRGMVDTKGGL